MAQITPHLVVTAACAVFCCSEEDLLGSKPIARTRRRYTVTAGLRLGLPPAVMAGRLRVRSPADALRIRDEMEAEIALCRCKQSTLWSIENSCMIAIGDPSAEYAT